MKILVPSNMTKSSQVAADFALSFFGNGASYLLLNSFPFAYRSGFYDSINNYTPEHDEIPLEKLKRERKRLIQKFGESEIDIKALYGNPVEDIQKVAQQEKVDLIVVGFSNFKKWKDGLSYRNQHAVMDLPYPIVLVPENHQYEATKKLYYVTDFSNNIESESTQLIRGIAQLSEAEITLYCFEKTPDDHSIEKWMLDKYLGGLEHTFKLIPNLQSGLSSLMEELKKEENAFIVFDFKTDQNALFENIESNVNNQLYVKPLLLMPKRYKNSLSRGA
ncbi:MAG: universal stress protein [Flavobacteriales bacterium]|nr:universal stress protein [Flavobacteriales bacterium]